MDNKVLIRIFVCEKDNRVSRYDLFSQTHKTEVQLKECLSKEYRECRILSNMSWTTADWKKLKISVEMLHLPFGRTDLQIDHVFRMLSLSENVKTSAITKLLSDFWE